MQKYLQKVISKKTLLFGLKILKFFDANPVRDPEFFDPGPGMEKFGSGIKIPDLQHWLQAPTYYAKK